MRLGDIEIDIESARSALQRARARAGKLIQALARIADRPALVLAGAAAVTALALAGIFDLRTGALRVAIDPAAEHLLPAAGPARDRFERARDLFGAEEPFVVALGADDVFQPAVLERVVALTAQLEALPEIHHVVSLARAPDVVSHDGEIELHPMLDRMPDSPEARAALRDRTLRQSALSRRARRRGRAHRRALRLPAADLVARICSRAASPIASKRSRARRAAPRSTSS